MYGALHSSISVIAMKKNDISWPVMNRQKGNQHLQSSARLLVVSEYHVRWFKKTIEAAVAFEIRSICFWQSPLIFVFASYNNRCL